MADPTRTGAPGAARSVRVERPRGTSRAARGPFVELRERAWAQMALERLDSHTAPRFERQLERWDLRVSAPPITWTGAAALVIPVTRSDGTAAMLKLNPDDEEVRHEHAALRAFDGDGAVRLLDCDPGAGALLLERLQPGEPLESHPDRDEAIGIVCGLLRRLWRPAPPGHPFATASELARHWGCELPARFQQTGGPFERSLLEAALAACEELARPAAVPVIANRDLHLGNVISAQREPWLLIDPQPVAGEPAFDLAYLAQDLLPKRPSASDLGRVLDRLSGELDVPPARVRLWMLVRQVDNALDGISAGHRWGARDLAIARLLRTPGPRRRRDLRGGSRADRVEPQ